MAIFEKLSALFLGNSSQQIKQIHSLEGIRGFAILFVFFDHAKGQGLELFSALNPTGFGKAGVYLFFVLSSFLLTGQFIREGYEMGRLPLLLSYGLKRILRIYPLYIFIMLMYGLVPSFKYTVSDVLNHVFLQEGKDQFWAIPVEFKFYILLPILMWLVVKVLNKKLGLSVLLFAVIAGASVMVSVEPDQAARIALVRYLPIFLCGSVSAMVHSQLQKSPVIERPAFTYGAEVVAIGAMIAVVSFILVLRAKLDWFILNQSWSDALIFSVFGLLWSLFLIAQLYGKGWIRGLLSHSSLRFIGTISFSIYLWHMALMGYFNAHLNAAQPMKFMVILAITIGVSMGSFLIIERPFFNLKQYLPK